MADKTLLLRDEGGTEHRVTIAEGDSVTVDGVTLSVLVGHDGSVVIQGSSKALAWTASSGDTRWVFLDGRVHTFEVDRAKRSRRGPAAHQGSLIAPMPATVRKVAVKTGDTVRRGDVLIVLEAMKMELPIRAPADGSVTAVHCREGELVQPGISLVEIGA